MPYSLKHKRDTRDKILESARRLFNKKGFSEVSIDEVMENAGLTRGGFYRHFRYKGFTPRLSADSFAPTRPSPGNPRRPKGWHASRAANASWTPTFPETISTTARRVAP